MRFIEEEVRGLFQKCEEEEQPTFGKGSNGSAPEQELQLALQKGSTLGKETKRRKRKNVWERKQKKNKRGVNKFEQ